MFEPESHAPRLSTSPDEDDINRYQSISKTALLTLAVGLFSPLGLIHPIFWPLAAIALLLGLLALWQIANDAPVMIGRRAAWIGIVLGLLFGTAGLTQWFAYRYMIRNEATRFSTIWFDLIQQNEPHKAYELTRHPDYRHSLDDNLIDFYADGSDARKELDEYLKTDEVQALLNLGENTTVDLHHTPSQWRQSGNDAIFQVYKITPSETDPAKPLYLGMMLERYRLDKPTRSGWRITRLENSNPK